ncbi:ABC transporter substrate-binding protein [Syntrophomonas curvata]
MTDRKYLRLMLILLIILLAVMGLRYWRANQDGGGKTITVTDCLDRRVQVPAKVERVACLYAFAGYATAMLGQGDKIVAVPDDLKQDVLLNEIYPDISRALVPVAEGSIDIEELLKADPDVVLVKNSTAADPAEAKKLEKSNIPYLAVDYSGIEEQQHAVTVIAQALGAAERGKLYNDYYQNCIYKVRKVAATIPEAERVRVYRATDEATDTDGPDTLAADWTQTAGAINVSVDQPLRHFGGKNSASLEQILQWDPDVILVNEPETAKYISGSFRWSPLKAVKESRVYQMPGGISRWGNAEGVETPLAVMWTAHLLYPERFPDINIKQEAQDFYQKIFNYQVSGDMLDIILNGEGMCGQNEQPG